MTIDIPEILTRPLRETVAGLANEATREALYGALRARREDVEPVVNAFEARREQSPRTAKGPLNGLPVTVKDQIAAGGWPRTFGLERPSRRADRASATIVARLVELGAEVTGKTALPPNALDFQTFNRRRGRTNNPHDPRFTAGGSSGGGAAAVASGMSLLDIGAELAGSLRLPAAWCGVTSLTPTEGAWPADGMLPGGQRLQHFARIGPIARRVDDLAFLWDCLAGAEAGKETSGSYRIGLWTPDGPAPMEAAARAVWDGFSTRLAATGIAVETDPMRTLFAPESYRLFGEIMGYETGALIPAPIRWLMRRDRSPARRSPGFLAHVHAGYRRDGARHADNLARMAAARREAAARFDGFDALALPVTGLCAFRHLAPSSDRAGVRDYAQRFDTAAGPLFYFDALTRFTVPVTLLGWPVVTLPIGRDANGIPLGVQVVGKPGRERVLLDLCATIETRLPAYSGTER